MEAGGGGSNPISENLRKALEDLRGAGEKATGDVRSRIDSAVQRLNDASNQATSRAQEQVSRATEHAGKATDQFGNWRETLDKATEDVRLQLAKLAVRAQSTTEGLTAIQEEVRKRKAQLKK
ncbi:MAG: hypothetical protein ABR536_04510 [Solirubrobacterales bacterium]